MLVNPTADKLSKYEPLCVAFMRAVNALAANDIEAMFAAMNILANVLMRAPARTRDQCAEDMRKILEELIAATEGGEVKFEERGLGACQ